jgi:ubiquinol-cytochrome c reductase cytochrome c1 subunit
MKKKLLAAAVLAATLMTVPSVGGAAGEAEHPPNMQWTFEGPMGTFDRAQLQRGYKVYKSVCANCHGMQFMSYRNLAQKGGPFYDEKYPNPTDNPVVKAIAAEYKVSVINDETGDVEEQPAVAASPFQKPFPNDAAARAANGGALPPDLSVITKARHGGADYIHALLTGYRDPPAGFEMQGGMNYNIYYSGNQIGMAAPLVEGIVEYDDGTAATVEQMSQDVTAFLTWAAEPKAETRKALGLQVMVYLSILAFLLYLSYRRLWKNVH